MPNALSPNPDVPISRRGLLVVAFLLAVFTVLTRVETIGNIEPDWDEGAYIGLAESILHGELPYVHAWDNKPPGTAMIYAAAIQLGGDPVTSIRVAAMLSVFMMSLGLVGITLAMRQSLLAGGLAGAFAILFMRNNGGMSANTEIFFTAFVCASLCLVAWLFHLRNKWTAIIFGACGGLMMGIGLIIKPVVLPDAFVAGCITIAAAVALCRQQVLARMTSVSVVAFYIIGMALPVLILITIYQLSGQFDALWQATVEANANRAGKEQFDPRKAVSYFKLMFTLEARQPILWAGSIMAVAWLFGPTRWGRSVNRWLALAMLAWICAGMAAISLQKTWYTHAFLHMVPALALPTGVFIAWLWHISSIPQRVGTGVLIALLLMPQLSDTVAFTLRDTGQHDPRRDVAQAIQNHTEPGQTIFIAKGPAMWYLLTETRPPTRYAGWTNWLWNPKWHQPFGIDLGSELEAIREQKPVLIVAEAQWFQEKPSTKTSKAPPQDPAETQIRAFKSWIKKHYQSVDRINNTIIYTTKSTSESQ